MNKYLIVIIALFSWYVFLEISYIAIFPGKNNHMTFTMKLAEKMSKSIMTNDNNGLWTLILLVNTL